MMTFTTDKLAKFEEVLQQSKRIVITAHKSPDADSIGSSLGLFHYLEKLGKEIVLCHPDQAPSFLWWLEGQDRILNYDDHTDQIKENFSNADLVFCLDYNSKGRIGKMEEVLVASPAYKVMIDHHREPDAEFCDLMFSDHENSSTSQMIYELMDGRNELDCLDEKVGTPLYAGMMMDTGSFRFPSASAETYRIAGELIKNGVKHWLVHERIHDTNTIDRLQLVSYALLEKLELLRDYKTAIIALNKDELSRFNATKGDTEGLVNQALSVEGIRMAVFFKESDGLIKMSFRSKGDVPVNDLARGSFEGGGHKNAAGGKHLGKIESAIDRFKKALPGFYSTNEEAFKDH